jgi:hypothetical protein
MNNQYLQWITGQRRGEVESVEMMQDGQTSQDVAILSNGRKVPMHNVGKDFIILPTAGAALNKFDLDMMYPIDVPKPQVKKQHQDIMGMDIAAPVESPTPPAKQKKASTFASDLLGRSKKEQRTITVNISMEIPTAAFFSMINQTFDESTINEVVDIIADSIDRQELTNSIKESIVNFYGETE